MGRAALTWSTAELAHRAAVGSNTVNRFEAGQDARISSVEKIRMALETAGILFIAENGEGPGVRLRKSAVPEPVAAISPAGLKASADNARVHAAGTLDRAMGTLDATGQEKAERRDRLTAVPELVKSARRKSKDASQ